MNDKDLIELVAKAWLENGGDSEGFVYNFYHIKNRIEELEEQNEGEAKS